MKLEKIKLKHLIVVEIIATLVTLLYVSINTFKYGFYLLSPLMFFNIGLLIYFISIFLRLYYKKNININLLKKSLIVCISFQLLLLVIQILNNSFLYIFSILSILYTLLWLIYILNLFYDYKVIINDKVFIGITITYILFDIIYNKFHLGSIISILPSLCAIPYFYNYSKIKKGEK